MQRLPALMSVGLLVSVLSATACDDESLCPYPNASPVETVPPAPCISASVETCIDPTVVVKNGCNAALYLPTAYGRFGPDGAVGADIELLVGQSARYVIRPEKAVSQSSTEKVWAIPARVGTEAIELRFKTFGGG